MASASVFSLLTTPSPSDSITQLKPSFSQFLRHQGSLFFYGNPKKRRRFSFPVARLFGPAIFEASKLKVLFLGVDEEQHPGHLPRTYTVTHSDITAKLTLAISQTINRAQLQGWYNKLQRDEVVAEWKKVQGRMSLHVHCHISGCHFLLDFIAKLRYYIFCKELPVVLKALIHGDGNLISKHPELEDALVWVYFHSNLQEFNRVECWGPLKAAAEVTAGETREVKEGAVEEEFPLSKWKRPKSCEVPCNCCFPTCSLIPWPQDFEDEESSKSLQKQLF